MSAHVARAQLLLAQSRPADAERESMLALAQQPDDPQALALLALSRLQQAKREPALDAARQAVGLAPDEPFLHNVHAHVLREQGRHDDALGAVLEAIRLDPGDADHFALLASIELGRGKWQPALEAAEQALALNAEHVGAANLRAMALVRLGRKAEAMESVDYALDRAPDDAFSHANQGWNHLHRNDPRKAQEHFREALRLDPELEYAREGMLEALKARNPIYRGMLAYFLWMGRQSARFQWAFIIGIYFGNTAIRSLASAQPQLKWLWWPLLGVFYAFVYLSWTAQPMFNLLLCFDRFGRHVLSRDQRLGAACFGTVFFAALASLAWWFAADEEMAKDLALFCVMVLAVISVCVAATFARTGRARIILASVTGLLAACAAGAAFADKTTGLVLANVFVIGFLGFQVLANVLTSRTR
ncbi:MAG: tetratricopeptide repeat protein [Opitutaceae bacterium]|nr:tetratricopeptide repeat protein [Opitutaceae bacterium]